MRNLARLFASARALNRIAAALEGLLAIEKERLSRELRDSLPPIKSSAKLAQIHVPSTKDMNEIYDEDRLYTGL